MASVLFPLLSVDSVAKVRLVQVVPFGRVLASNMIGPVADSKLLVELGVVGTSHRHPPPKGVAHMKDATIKVHVGVVTRRTTFAAELDADLANDARQSFGLAKMSKMLFNNINLVYIYWN